MLNEESLQHKPQQVKEVKTFDLWLIKLQSDSWEPHLTWQLREGLSTCLCCLVLYISLSFHLRRSPSNPLGCEHLLSFEGLEKKKNSVFGNNVHTRDNSTSTNHTSIIAKNKQTTGVNCPKSLSILSTKYRNSKEDTSGYTYRLFILNLEL